MNKKRDLINTTFSKSKEGDKKKYCIYWHILGKK